MDKNNALKYLVTNERYSDEWSGTGMYHALVKIIMSEDILFTEEFLIKLLEEEDIRTIH